MILCIIVLKTIDLTPSKSKAGISDHGVTSDVYRRYFIDADLIFSEKEKERDNVNLKGGRWTIKDYIYISDTKVDMLFAQIPKNILKKITAELNISVGMVSISLKERQSEQTRFDKVKRSSKAAEDISLKNRQIFGAINKMEFELQGFKFSLTVDEIKQIVGLIKENIDRDKKNLCLLLYLTNEVILDWYNAIIKGVPPQLLIRIATRK